MFCKYSINDVMYYDTGYDDNGALVSDAKRGITSIEHDLRSNPRLIQFSDGSQTEYVYSALGEKLKTIHRTATPYTYSFDGGEPVDMISMAPSLDGVVRDTLEAKHIVLEVDSTEYIGSFIFENGRADKYLFPGGYYFYAEGHPSCTGGDGSGYYYYLTDHLGNNRVVENDNGDIEQTTHYYPFGAIYADAGKNLDFQKFKYTGKELDLTHGLNTYDHGARQNYSILGVWDRVDPLVERSYNMSPYAVCEDAPLISIDSNGESTWVVNAGKGKYKVIGGDLNDKDRNIYLYSMDKMGRYTVRGKSIGITLVNSSFYNSDEKKWAVGSIINTQDNSGNRFISSIRKSNMSLPHYVLNAGNGQRYDFKSTNGSNRAIYSQKQYYRGMPISLKGKTYYASARDVGNLMAGYVAGASGLKWSYVEMAFDKYQSQHSSIPEGISSREAQKLGFLLGHNSLPNHGTNNLINIAILLSSILSK